LLQLLYYLTPPILINLETDIFTRFKTILILVVFLFSTMANVFFMKKTHHVEQKIQSSFISKNTHLTWFSPFHPREKNITVTRTTVPRIKFSGVISIFAFFGSLSLITIIKLPQSTGLYFNSLQKICITQCVLKI
jgi:hypothetical protein